MSKKNRRNTSSLAVVAGKANPNYQTVIQAGPTAIPVMMPRNMRAYLQEGYRNKTAFRVVGQIARSGAGIKWKHYYDRSKQREYSSSPLLDLWNRPNSEQGGSKFRENLLGYYCLTGNSYVLGINASQNPRAKFDELYCLRPDLTKVHISEQYEPDYYEFGPAYPYKNYPKPFVMHSKLFAGSDDVYGLSPVEVAAMLVDIQKASQKWNLSLMSNMAAPSGAWVTKQILNDPDYRNLKKEIRDKFSGPRNAREPIILHGGVEWKSMSMTPMELDFLSSEEKTDRDIAGIFFNFPTFLLGLADATFANQSEAKHYLYTDIIFPIWDMFVDDLNSWLTPRYGGYLDYDREDVETIQERIQAAKAQASDRAMSEFAGGTTTFLEAREIQGKETLSVKDFVMVKDVPVHVESLDEYIAAMSDKVINPPAPPPQLMLPHPGNPPGTTTVTEEPGNNDANDGDNQDENENSGDNSGNKMLALPAPKDEKKDAHTTHTVQHTDVSVRDLLLPDDDGSLNGYDPDANDHNQLYMCKALDLTTTEQKEEYFSSMEALRGKWEPIIEQRLQDYFQDERKTIVAAIERDDDTESADDRVEHAFKVLEQQGALKQLIVKLYQDVGTEVGNAVAEELKSESGPDAQKGVIRDFINLFGPKVLEYLLTLAGTKIQQITTTTLAKIRLELTDGVARGESIPKLAKRIDALYLDQIIPNRSTTIARTEVCAASNQSVILAGKSSGLTLHKVWLATEDERTRPDHTNADGQEVGIDEDFTVGSEKLAYPGANTASAKQVVNCRCTTYLKRVKPDVVPEPDNTEKSSSRLDRREEYREFMKGMLMSQVKEVTV